MNKNDKVVNKYQHKRGKGNGKNYDSRRKGKSGSKDRGDDPKEEGSLLNPAGRDNNPNWYFLDKQVAEQVSQLAFQQLADMPVEVKTPHFNGSIITYDSTSANIASIVALYVNPAPGVQLDSVYTQGSVLQRSAINLSGFRLFSKLAAYTGRQAIYGPQDISTMILYMGEIISTIEWLRRAFGVCYTMNMYNRAYPKRILEAMSIDATDLFTNYSSYRTRFNAIITRVNQIPIPKNIAYFDKCAALYEKVYLDQESPMAQNIVLNPATTWRLDETSYSGGTILSTEAWCTPKSGGASLINQPLSHFLSIVENMVDDLMSSSTFNVVYTDLLNLATKTGVEFWKFDYLLDGYVLYPEFNANFLLMIHNATFTRVPSVPTLVPTGITPYNDVYPNPTNNALFYNPGFTFEANEMPRVPVRELIVDSTTPMPSVEDRIEMLKFTSFITAQYKDASNQNYGINAVLSDHYFTSFKIMHGNTNSTEISSSIMGSTAFHNAACAWSQVDWAPIIYEYTKTGNDTSVSPYIHGDLNFYTVIDSKYLRKIVDFSGFGLYDMR